MDACEKSQIMMRDCKTHRIRGESILGSEEVMYLSWNDTEEWSATQII